MTDPSTFHHRSACRTNDFSTYVPGYKTWIELLMSTDTLPSLTLRSHLLGMSSTGLNERRSDESPIATFWWEFQLISGNKLLCEARVYEPALALPTLIAVVKDTFPEPLSRHPEARSDQYMACEALREIFRAPPPIASPQTTQKPEPEPA